MINHLVPSEFYLGQNYPNPFKEKTIIKYCVAFKSNVQIVVYDAEGKEVEKLVDEVKQPGTYQAEFSSAVSHFHKSRELYSEMQRMPDGYYFYRMKAGDYLSEKKWLCKNELL